MVIGPIVQIQCDQCGEIEELDFPVGGATLGHLVGAFCERNGWSHDEERDETLCADCSQESAERGVALDPWGDEEEEDDEEEGEWHDDTDGENVDFIHLR